MAKHSSIAASLVVLAVIAVTPARASAVPIQHVFTGPVTETSPAFPQVEIGDPFTATLGFDTAEVPTVIGTSAFYTNFTFEVAVEGLVFLRAPLTTLVVENDSVLGDRFVIDGVGIGQAGFFFEDPSGTAFTSLALPSVLDLADFAAAQILVETESGFIRGDITSVETNVVPEPSALLVLSIAGAIALANAAVARSSALRKDT